jgi:hypothetical protein
MPTFEIRRREERERVWVIDAENAQDALDWTETVEPIADDVRLLDEQVSEITVTPYVVINGELVHVDDVTSRPNGVEE